MKPIQCRYFSGYKPCKLNVLCNDQCKFFNKPSLRILIVHLGAIGAVVRATSLLKPIHDKYPRCHITWVTDSPSHHLLLNHSAIDRLLITNDEGLLILSALSFDVAFCIDKSLKAAGVLSYTQYDQLFGFTVDSYSGAIIPAQASAHELWEIGLNDQKKFFENKKSEVQLMIEALDLNSKNCPEYWIELAEAEKEEGQKRHQIWRNSRDLVVGINTGCATTIAYKKPTITFFRNLIKEINKEFNVSVVLLGGREDTERNQVIAQNNKVILSSTTDGLRDGLLSVYACDLVITGDSLGMHMAIAMKKWVLAWFGPTCEHEIEFYGRGIGIKSDMDCSPCWKRQCFKEVKCNENIELDWFMSFVRSSIQKTLRSFNQTLDL